MAYKNCTDCILDGTDACSRGAGRAVNDEICEDFQLTEERDCENCKHYISKDGNNGCESWECEFEPKENKE